MNDLPYGQTGRPGISSRARNAMREERDFGSTAEGSRIQQLERDLSAALNRIATLEQWRASLRGDGGIEIRDNVISAPRREILDLIVETRTVALCDPATGQATDAVFIADVGASPARLVFVTPQAG